MGTMLKPFSKIKGDFAELLACLWLFVKGYRILGRNIKGKFAEIDVLCARGDSLIAVEVKYRKTEDSCHIAVHPKQRDRQNRQLELFLSTYTKYSNFRIDYLFVFPHPCFIKHIVAAQID